MRIKTLIVMCAVVGTAMGAGGAGTANAAAPSKRCYPAKASTFVQNDQVRIFYRGRFDDAVHYACNLRSGRITRLGEFTTVSLATLAFETVGGRFVAYVDAECSQGTEDCSGSRIVVVDSKTGKTRRGPPSGVGSQGPWGVVLRSNGTAAYIMDELNAGYEVHRFAGGVDTVLDAGTGIDRSSLALGGARLYWVKGGVAQTALI